jgi:hypothetical protein
MAIANITNNILTDSGVATSSLQPTITLTTTGTSGAATLVGATLNIPQYQAAGTYVTSVTASAPLSSSGSTNPNITITQVSSTVDGYLSFSDYNVFSGKISGLGTAGYITRYTGSGSTIGNSGLYDDGTTVSLISRALSGSSASFSVSSGTVLNVAGNAIFRGDTGVATPRQLIIQSGGSTPVYLEAKGYGANYQTDFGIRTFNSVGTSFEVFYANANGNVGINQTSPAHLLDVNGTFRAVGVATFSANVTLNKATGNAISTIQTGSASVAINIYKNSIKEYELGCAADGSFTLYDATAVATRLTIASTGAATFSSTIKSSDTNGFAIGSIASFRRIQYGSDAATAFSLLTDTNSYAGLYAGAATFSAKVSAKGGSNFGGYYMDYQSDASSRSFRVSSEHLVFADFVIQRSTTRTGTTYEDLLYFDANRAATFSSSVFAASYYGQTLTTSSQAAINLNNTIDNQICLAGNARMTVVDYTTTKYLFTITPTGNVGIGTSSPSQILDVRKATASGDTQFNFVNSQNSSSGNTSVTSSIYLGFFDDSSGLASANKIVSGKSGDYTSAPTANSFLAFYTTAANSCTEKMRITSGGIVDIAGPLVIRGVLPADQTDAAVIDHFSSTMRIFSYGASGVTGDFQFRTAAGGAGSNLVSTINGTTGVYVAVSNINRKKDFEESTIGLNEILGLKPTLYRMKDDDELANKELGFIAQEVKEFIPQAYVESGKDENKFIGLNYQAITTALVKAVQELKAEIDILKNK